MEPGAREIELVWVQQDHGPITRHNGAESRVDDKHVIYACFQEVYFVDLQHF